ncbi:HTTM domain-containing protein [Yinghuangia sp. YIM S09857]|uniref:HTTM domain-containing protein n=1 Tax=Yinghuangia sp. YIM S09857 TaxID=3436929 RepID=UPI003F53DD3F
MTSVDPAAGRVPAPTTPADGVHDESRDESHGASTAEPTDVPVPVGHAESDGTGGRPDTAASAAPKPAPARLPLDVRLAEGLLALLGRITGRPRGLYQAALLRIGFGSVFLASLLREFLNRREIWGDQSPWSPDMARRLLSGIDGVSILLVRDERWWFELMFAVAVLATTLFVLGWHTRAMSVLFCVMVVSFNSRSLLMTDSGDTVLLLMSFYLMFTACGRVWSLDARRERRTGQSRSPGPGHEWGVFVALFAVVAAGLLLPWWASVLGAVVVLAGMWRLPLELEQVRAALVAAMHHCALFVIAAQVCVVYAAAGLYKVQGKTWQDGTAMHYALNLEYFQPFPGLSGIVDGGELWGTALAYLTVFTQVGFAFLVFAKRAKYTVIAIMVGMHLGIAVLLGLPAFSAAMALGDLVFLPTAFLLFAAAWGGRAVRWTGGRLRGRPDAEGAPRTLDA